MVNVGVAVATSAWFLASADEDDALATVDLIARAAAARLALEQTQNATAEILAAWQQVVWRGARQRPPARRQRSFLCSRHRRRARDRTPVVALNPAFIFGSS